MYISDYLIDDEVVFQPRNRMISSLITNKTSVIHSPASRCLHLLIEKRTSVVSQTDLYKAGWGDDALKNVSTATYYQCFVNLRKQLREIGYQGELLLTIPKEGIKFNEDIAVIPYTSQECPSRKVSDRRNANPLLNKKKITRLSIICRPSFHAMFKMVLLFCILMIFGYNLLRPPYSHIPDEELYKRYPSLPFCVNVYVKDSVNFSLEILDGFLQSSGHICKSNTKLYVYIGIVRMTIYECPENMQCMSFTYIREKT